MIESRRRPGPPPGPTARNTEAYRSIERERARARYRRANGIPLDAPITTGAGRWRDTSWQCTRCREPHAPGSDLCADHLQIMAELGLGENEE